MHAACEACAKNADCPAPLKALCRALATLSAHEGEIHATVCACRDVASRCGVEACKEHGKGWRKEAEVCFRMCDACDKMCHQRCTLAEALSGAKPLRCAFKSGPAIPGTAPYAAPTTLTQPCVVYCASTSCAAASLYCHKAKAPCVEYPGGLLEYVCRCECDPSLPPLPPADAARCLAMEFNECGGGSYACHP